MLDWSSRKKAGAQIEHPANESVVQAGLAARTASPTRKNHWKVPPRRNFFPQGKEDAKPTLAECFVLAIWQVVETITTPARIVCTRFEQDDQT